MLPVNSQHILPMVPVQQVFIGFIVFRQDKVSLIKGLLHELFPYVWCGKGMLCSIRLIKETKSTSDILLEFGMIAEDGDESFSALNFACVWRSRG